MVTQEFTSLATSPTLGFGNIVVPVAVDDDVLPSAPSTQFGTTLAKPKSTRGLVVPPSHLRLWDNQVQGHEFDKEQDHDAFSMVGDTSPSTTTPILFQWFQNLLLAADDNNNNNVPNGHTIHWRSIIIVIIDFVLFRGRFVRSGCGNVSHSIVRGHGGLESRRSQFHFGCVATIGQYGQNGQSGRDSKFDESSRRGTVASQILHRLGLVVLSTDAKLPRMPRWTVAFKVPKFCGPPKMHRKP